MKKLLLAAALIAASTSAQACDLFMELRGQSLHVVAKDCPAQYDQHLRIKSRDECVTHITGIEQVDYVTWLVHYQDLQCKITSPRALVFQLIGDETLRITDADNS